TAPPDAHHTLPSSPTRRSSDLDNASFNVSGSNLRTTAAFDFETKSSYSIKVRSTDAGALFFEKTLTITITNVNEAPVAVDDTYSIPGGTVTVSAPGVLANDTDPDAGDTRTAVPVTGPAHTSGTGRSFALSPDGGFRY